MRLLYAVQFEVQPGEGQSLEAVCDQAKQRIIHWIRTWYPYYKTSPIEFPPDGKRLEPVKGHSIHPVASSAPSGESVWGVTWSYPDRKDATQQWETKVILARTKTKVDLSFSVYLTSSVYQVSPYRYNLSRPRIVADLIDELDCRLGPIRLVGKIVEVTAADFPAFVDTVLLSEDRQIPVIVLARQPGTKPGGWPADLSSLADRLAGLALVVPIPEVGELEVLRSALSPGLSINPGECRIYWPRLSRASNPFEHPLYREPRIERLQQSALGFEGHIVTRVINTASARFTESPVAQEVRAAIQKDQLSRQRQTLADLSSTKATAGERERQVLELQNNMEQKDAYIEALEKENENLKNQWRDFEKYSSEEVDDREPAQAPQPGEPISSVSDALSRAEQDYSGQIEVWETARESAAASGSEHGPKVYRALGAMSEVAQEYFAAKREKRSMGGDFEQAFSKRGFAYHSRESDTAMGGRMGKQRIFRDGERTMVMERHITIGGAHAVNPVRIHFEPSDDAGKFIVGYCGPHLDYPRKRT